MKKRNFFSLTCRELENLLVAEGMKKYTARQLFGWIYAKNISDFSSMSDISRDDRVKLTDMLELSLPEKTDTKESPLDKTKKILFSLTDGKKIETVFMPQEKRKSVCLSTQAGCPVRCSFCLSGISGLKRSLETEEIIGQFMHCRKEIFPEKISTVVFMGIGEPLLNISSLLKSIEILADQRGLAVPVSSLIVSTVGIPEGIRALADSSFNPGLSFSLHAATDGKRQRIIPLAKKYNLDTIMDALKYFQKKKNRLITIEYTPFFKFNDTDDDAREIGRLLSGLKCKINLIQFNKAGGFAPAPGQGMISYNDLLPLDEKEMIVFQEKLIRRGFLTIIRRSRGKDILAACGELTAGN